MIKITLLFLLLSVGTVSAQDSNFNVMQYGATGSGTVMDTAALQKAIDAAAAAGGGTVEFPAGTYLSGSLYLKSHVALQLDEGATLLGSPHRMDYHKVNQYALLLADDQEDIAVRGKGTIDGQGVLLAADAEALWNNGQLSSKEKGRPSIINFRRCKHVTVQGITLKNSAYWVEDYRDCDDLTIENITVQSIAAENNDGLDIDGCVHVVVRGCDIDSEDDGICLKSTDRACDDVLVENCRVRSSCNALKFGTDSKVGFKNIIARNLEIYDTYLSAIALELVDGGEMANVNISHVKITDAGNAIFIRLGHRNVDGEVGSIHDVTISDVTAEISDRPLDELNKFPATVHQHVHTLITSSITGLPGNPVQNITLQNISITYGGIGNAPPAHHAPVELDHLAKVPERETKYPESTTFGTLPAWGFYCRHTQGLKFDNVTLNVEGSDYRPAVVCDDATGLVLNAFHVLSAGSQPVIVLNDVNGATIQNSSAPAGAVSFIKTMGSTQGVNQE